MQLPPVKTFDAAVFFDFELRPGMSIVWHALYLATFSRKITIFIEYVAFFEKRDAVEDFRTSALRRRTAISNFRCSMPYQDEAVVKSMQKNPQAWAKRQTDEAVTARAIQKLKAVRMYVQGYPKIEGRQGYARARTYEHPRRPSIFG